MQTVTHSTTHVHRHTDTRITHSTQPKHRHTDTQTHRHTEIDADADTDTDTDTDTATDTDTDTGTHCHDGVEEKEPLLLTGWQIPVGLLIFKVSFRKGLFAEIPIG